MKTVSASFLTLLCAAAGATALVTVPLRADSHVDVGLSVGIPLPHGYVDVVVGREHYYSYRGVFYRRGPRGFVVVRAPRGAILRELPPHCARIYVGASFITGMAMFITSRCRGATWWWTPRRSDPPPPPPADGVPIGLGGPAPSTCSRTGSSSRRPRTGMVWREAPLGAVTKTLPPDATSIWYQDNEYFECDNVYFRKTPDGYKVVPRPFPK